MSGAHPHNWGGLWGGGAPQEHFSANFLDLGKLVFPSEQHTFIETDSLQKRSKKTLNGVMERDFGHDTTKGFEILF